MAEFGPITCVGCGLLCDDVTVEASSDDVRLRPECPLGAQCDHLEQHRAGVVLAAVGIYGVMSYSVAQQTREIGIRIALGAQRRDVLRMTVKEGLKLVGVGLLIGLTSAFVLTRVMESLLFGISATDPITFGIICVVLLMVAALASYIPALRATTVDPMVALRAQ